MHFVQFALYVGEQVRQQYRKVCLRTSYHVNK